MAKRRRTSLGASSGDTIYQVKSFRELARAKPLRLNGCMRLVVGGKPAGAFGGKTQKREFRLCAVGGEGHGAQLQVITPGDGSKELIIGDVNKACRLKSWPLITYAKDYSPEAIASIRNLSGAKKRRRKR